jgi:hypothetical protein
MMSSKDRAIEKKLLLENPKKLVEYFAGKGKPVPIWVRLHIEKQQAAIVQMKQSICKQSSCKHKNCIDSWVLINRIESDE